MTSLYQGGLLVKSTARSGPKHNSVSGGSIGGGSSFYSPMIGLPMVNVVPDSVTKAKHKNPLQDG